MAFKLCQNAFPVGASPGPRRPAHDAPQTPVGWGGDTPPHIPSNSALNYPGFSARHLTSRYFLGGGAFAPNIFLRTVPGCIMVAMDSLSRLLSALLVLFNSAIQTQKGGGNCPTVWDIATVPYDGRLGPPTYIGKGPPNG